MKATTGHIDEAADRAINERVVQQHPHMKPITARPTTQCFYEGAPAVTVRTGDLGNRFGLCAECATAHDASVTARRILDQLEIDRAAMQTAGKSTPAYEEFVDHLAAIISYPRPCGRARHRPPPAHPRADRSAGDRMERGVTEMHTTAAAEDTLGRPAGAEHGDAAYWARIRRIADQAPPLTDLQRARIRAAFHQPGTIKETAA